MNNLLILIDIQKEYTTPGRPFYLKGIEPSLQNCKKLLEHARQHNWEIVHIKHLKEGAPRFNPNSEYADFDARFQPKKGEKVFTKNLYSCYSNPDFAQFIELHKNDNIYLIGYNSIMCCLSTVIDGYHRDHHLNFVYDCIYAKSTDQYSEEDMHNHVVSIIKTARYANIIEIDQLIRCQETIL